jgi:hypothetical protein
MGDRRELRSFVAVVLLIGVVSATAFVSCGGGGGGDSNGDLCEQCGDTDGPCNVAGADVPADDLTNGCPDPQAASCHVTLSCVRKVDSGQRRCFPLDPTTGELDFFFKCDGSRPIQSFAPTLTPTATITPVPSASETPASPGPTATGLTPTATGLTPTATATPDADNGDLEVTIDFETDEDSLPTFNVQVSYPSAKGNFTPLDCDDNGDGIVAQDSGSGILTLSFASNPEESTSVGITCTFHQIEGQTLIDGDLNASGAPSTVTVTVEDL